MEGRRAGSQPGGRGRRPALREVDQNPPLRTCAGCGLKQSQRAMWRVAAPNGAEPVVDLRYRAAGRGAYLCRDAACLEQALKRRALERSLKLKQALTPALVAELRRALAGGQAD